jgi:casein kinase 1
MIGTARYASMNALRGDEQSRRDDIQAVAYMLMYMCQGSLPWMHVRDEDKNVKYSKILKMKETISMDLLSFNLPKVV